MAAHCRTCRTTGFRLPGVDTRRHLHSANRQLLAVPHYRLNTYGRQAFSAAGPTVWNPLRILSGTRTSVLTVSDVCLKRNSLLNTRLHLAIAVMRLNENEHVTRVSLAV